MFVIMCGLPLSGKTCVSKVLFDFENDWVLRPSDYLPLNFDTLNENEKSRYYTASWQISIQNIEKLLLKLDNDRIIVLDCCNSKSNAISNLMCIAHREKHKICLVYVSSDSKSCIERSGDNTIGYDIIKKYIVGLKSSLQVYKKKCDRIIVIKNDGTIEQLISKCEQVKENARIC